MGAPTAVTAANQTERQLIERLGEASGLDAVIDPVQEPLEHLLARRAGLPSFLHGTWLAHAIHPMLTDIPIGAWTAGCVLDLLDALGINRNLRQGSDAVTTVGLVGALAAAVFGIADWSYTGDKPKRVGFVHGALNITIAGLYAGSLAARAKGKRARGVALSAMGFDLLLLSSWLGGELVYRFGVGVNRSAFHKGPTEWVDVASDQELTEGALRRVEADGVPVLLTRVQGEVRAVGDTCTHQGCSLADGELHGDMIVCSCHGSGFRLSDGQVQQGPATASPPTFQVRLQGGRVAVKRA